MSNNTETEDVEVESSATDNNGWDFVEDEPAEAEEPQAEETEVEEPEESEETEAEVEVEAEDAEDSDASESESEEEEQEEAEPAKKEEPRIPLSRLRKEIMKRKAAEAKLQKPEVKEGKQEPQSGEPDFPALTYDAEVDRQNQAKYYKDLAAYEREQLKEELALEDRKKQQAEREAADLRRIEEAKESDPEYRQALEDVFSDEEETEFVTSQMTQDLYEAIQEFGTPLEKYVLQNRHEVMPKLADLQGRSFDREIGRIMGRLEAAPTPKPAPKKPKQKSKAPPAIKQVTKGTSKVQPVADGWKIE